MIKKKEIALVLTTTFLTSLLGLILIEGYYLKSGYSSLVCEICQFHPKLGWETLSGKTISNGKVKYSTNSMGMRSEEVDFSKGHILLTGDSVTFGLGVNNNETVSHYLEKEYKKYQVLNLGVPGYGIGQYFLNLQRHIDRLNSKLIVLIIYTGNDLDETRKETRYGISKPFFHYQNGKLHHLNPHISQYSCANIYTLSRFVKYLIPKTLIDKCQVRVIERNKASLTIAKLIHEIRALGLQKNIPTLIVLSPALTAVEATVCRQSGIPSACDEYDIGFEAYYDYFHTIMKVHQLPYIDFIQNLIKFSYKEDIRTLYGNNRKDIHHYSPKGNSILSKAITKRLSVEHGKIIKIKPEVQ